MLGGDRTVRNGQQAAYRAADADEKRTQAERLHDSGLKAPRQAALEENAEGGAGGDGDAVDNGTQPDHIRKPSFALLY